MKWTDHVNNFGHAGSDLAVTARVARLLLLAFVMTFLTASIIVFLIAEQYIPNLFLFVGGTHVHHLNYGIYLLSVVGLLLLLFRPKRKGLYLATIGYGIGLALTFDEFGMWLFLGGSYNNHLTFDAIVIIGSLLTLIALATTVEKYHPRHWVIAAAVAVLVAFLIVLAAVAFRQGVMEKVFTVRGL
jgi:multisubunit Na+/H+ antiporter MnhB subunit